MLHWLAGQKPHDNDAGPDATGYEDAPETPAPVFAVRAFKHAIFGTPATQAKPRRHSNNETSRPRPRQNGRPGMPRPQSANVTQTLGRAENAIDEEPVPSSPTKGILLTPGTATARRKTVSFGLNVVDNEQKRPVKSGLPDDCPGKFPSPWSKSTAELDSDEPAEKPRGRSKLTEQFEQVREESAKRKSRSSRQQREKEDGDTTLDLAEPTSDSGKYWKREYDIYRENTTKEVKKLVEKQRSAKRYASEKDAECQEARDELRRERKRVERLEKRTAELEAQLNELQEKMMGNQNEDQASKVQAPTTGSSVNVATPHQQQIERPELAERNSWRESLVQLSRRDIKPEGAKSGELPEEQKKEEPKLDRHRNATTEPKARPRRIQTKLKDDLWAPSSSLGPPEKLEQNPPSPKFSHPATTVTNPTPLQSLSVNSIAQNQDSMALAMSMGMQPPSPQRESRQDSPMRSPVLPAPSPEHLARSPPRPSSWARKNSKSDESTMAVPESSLFQPEAVSERPNVLTGQPVPIRPTLRPSTKAPDVKENVSPAGKAQQPRNEENVKPSAAWNAMSNVAAERRIVSKEGKEFEADRLAKARARLQSRGRQVS